MCFNRSSLLNAPQPRRIVWVPLVGNWLIDCHEHYVAEWVCLPCSAYKKWWGRCCRRSVLNQSAGLLIRSKQWVCLSEKRRSEKPGKWCFFSQINQDASLIWNVAFTALMHQYRSMKNVMRMFFIKRMFVCGSLVVLMNKWVFGLASLIHTRLLLNHQILLFLLIFGGKCCGSETSKTWIKSIVQVCSPWMRVRVCMCVCVLAYSTHAWIRRKEAKDLRVVQVYNHGLKMDLKCPHPLFLLEVRTSFKYLNDMYWCVTLNPFSRFINWRRKSGRIQSERLKLMNKRGQRELFKAICLKFCLVQHALHRKTSLHKIYEACLSNRKVHKTMLQTSAVAFVGSQWFSPSPWIGFWGLFVTQPKLTWHTQTVKSLFLNRFCHRSERRVAEGEQMSGEGSPSSRL